MTASIRSSRIWPLVAALVTIAALLLLSAPYAEAAPPPGTLAVPPTAPDPQFGLTWTAWQDLGGTLTSAPAAVSWGRERITVFARGGTARSSRPTKKAAAYGPPGARPPNYAG